MKILEELDVDPANAQRVVQAWNKVDLLAASDKEDMLSGNGFSQSHFPISAVFGDGIEALLQKVDGLLRVGNRTEVVRLSCADGKQRSWLFGERVVRDETLRDDSLELTVCWSAAQAARFRNRFGCHAGAESVACQMSFRRISPTAVKRRSGPATAGRCPVLSPSKRHESVGPKSRQSLRPVSAWCE